MSVHIGTCGARTGSIIVSMAEPIGDGDDSGALVCTFIACEPCTEITRDTGGACDPTGICGGAIITTSDPVGSGEINIARLAGTDTA